MVIWILAAALGCTGKSSGQGEILLTEESLDFGSVAVGTFLTKQLGLENIGDADADLLSSTVFEGDPAIWLVDREGEGILAPGEYVVFSISFQPTTRGSESARLQIRTDLSDQATLYLDLSGQGTASLDDDDGDGYSPADGDCDDADPSRNPGADEQCNGVDDDCSGSVPEEEEDRDYDGLRYCEGDCDDDDNAVYPDAPEICDDKDNDCDGHTPDREDADGDEHTLCDGDCDDSDPSVWPFSEELCDNKDNDCDTDIDEVDEDRDGVTACEGDCDDYNPDAWPVFVSTTGGTASDDPKKKGADGSPQAPFDTISEAADHLDTICQTVILAPGAYSERHVHLSGRLRVQGGGDWPEDVYLNARSGSADRIFEASGKDTLLELSNITLYSADITGDGGAVRAEGADLLVENAVFLSNTVTGSGGAIWLQDGTLTITDSEVQYSSAGVSGGAIWVGDGTLSASEVVFFKNDADSSGGAIYATDTAVTLSDIRLWSNEATDQGGGICLNSPTSGSVLRHLWSQDNLASLGGGIAITGDAGETLLSNSTFLGDGADDGAGIYTTASGGLWVWSNIVAHPENGAGIKITHADTSAAYNLAYTTSGTALDIATAADDGENLTADPGFEDYTGSESPTSTDLSLSTSSPAIDSGPTTGGPAKTNWTDANGTRNDRGYTGGPD
ncbi:MAG: putative outer membrane repeat protein [Myxococcota bacterium]|jgi:predicted outer membrane repeat protein